MVGVDSLLKKNVVLNVGHDQAANPCGARIKLSAQHYESVFER